MTRKLKRNEYRCAACQGVFDKGWSDEEAKEEFYDNHPGEPIDETTALICDVCYEAMRKDMAANPWKYPPLD
jgi:hypothetical protein